MLTTTAPTRTTLATVANVVGRASRKPGAPTLTVDATREDLIAWLVWCDRNGCWTDADCEIEGYGPLSLTDAWEALALLLLDDALTPYVGGV